MAQEFKRKTKWDGWPFTSMAEAADLFEQLYRLVVEVEETINFSARLDYEGEQHKFRTVEELRKEAPGLSFDALQGGDVFAAHGAGLISAALFLFSEGDPNTTLLVDGMDQTAVEGVNVRGKELVERGLEQQRRAEEAATEAAEKERRDAAWWRRLNNPWAVAIIGGLVVTVVGGIIVALLVH